MAPSAFPGWPETMRVLWLGAAIVNNLVEPEIQAGELLERLPGLEDWLAGSVPQEMKEVVYRELACQVEALSRFYLSLDEALKVMKSLLQGVAGVGRPGTGE